MPILQFNVPKVKFRFSFVFCLAISVTVIAATLLKVQRCMQSASPCKRGSLLVRVIIFCVGSSFFAGKFLIYTSNNVRKCLSGGSAYSLAQTAHICRCENGAPPARPPHIPPTQLLIHTSHTYIIHMIYTQKSSSISIEIPIHTYIILLADAYCR